MGDKYVTVKQIGRGSFGKCILVQRKVDKRLFVLKEVNVQEMTPNERKEAMNEVTVLSVLRYV
jgi:NIMA (never in mitosis gene a)-related kinase 1/4/5